MRNRPHLEKKDKISLIPIFLVIIILILVIIGLSIQINNSIWDGTSRFTIVFNSDPLVLLSLEPRTHKAVLLSIPVDTILNVPSGFEEYKVSSVYQLGNLEKNKNGGKLLSKAIENTFGIAVDRYVSERSSSFTIPNAIKEDFLKIKKSYFSFMSLPKSVVMAVTLKTKYDTNLTFVEMYHLWNGLRKMRGDEFSYQDLSDSTLLVESKLPDQTTVRRVNGEILDSFIDDKFQDQRIRTENVTIAIINAAEKDKLATQMGKVLKYIGGNVLRKSTASNPDDNGCNIYVTQRSLEKSIVVSWLKRKYLCQVIFENDQDTVEQTDINIFLGKGFLK